MIEFSGQISNNIQIDRAKRLIKYETMLFSVSGIGIVILGIVLGLLLGFLKDIWIREQLSCRSFLLRMAGRSDL